MIKFISTYTTRELTISINMFDSVDLSFTNIFIDLKELLIDNIRMIMNYIIKIFKLIKKLVCRVRI